MYISPRSSLYLYIAKDFVYEHVIGCLFPSCISAPFPRDLIPRVGIDSSLSPELVVNTAGS